MHSCQISLTERVMLDALAERVGPDQAPEVLRRTLLGTPVPPARDADAEEITAYLHAHLGPTLRRELGAALTDEVVCAAEALLGPLFHDLLLDAPPPFRAPYILLSDQRNDLEGVIDLRRVTTLIDVLLEADGMPEATLVVDVPATSVSLASLAVSAGDLPTGMQILIVAASEAERAEYESMARRAATFCERYLALDLRPACERRRAA